LFAKKALGLKNNNMENKKLKIAVLMGGNSSEREVSLSSGKQVLENLNKEKFDVFAYDTKADLEKLFLDIKAKKIDVCFIALHGKGGEDGAIQGMLDVLNIPYTGCGVLASAVGMDKNIFKMLLNANSIITPNDLQVGALTFPCVIKPSKSGSSVGVSIIESQAEFALAFGKAQKASEGEVMIEELIKGREITVGVLGNKELQVLPVVEICPKNKFFDYQAKYDADFCTEIVPAKIPSSAKDKAQVIALNIYRLLGCRGFSRIDMILKDSGELVVLEINTIPGLTPNSLLPKAAKAAGISFALLLEKVINLAQEK